MRVKSKGTPLARPLSNTSWSSRRSMSALASGLTAMPCATVVEFFSWARLVPFAMSKISNRSFFRVTIHPTSSRSRPPANAKGMLRNAPIAAAVSRIRTGPIPAWPRA